MASRRSPAGSGPLITPLSAFTDGQTGKIVWIVPGVIKKTHMSTDFLCTNLDTVPIDIGVEAFDLDGTQLNKLDGSISITGSTCPTGAVLAVPPGSTVTIGLTGTAQLHEDCKIEVTAIAQGSARIVSTGKIGCDAIALDDKHVVADPALCSTCQPPPLTSLKLIKPKKQSGD
ncbi:MAG: hypothetical protein AUH78_00125 [Gemmatimonadetes bacterium 13_1_40CM_4_69_8]|nr:MAG: hypothetical protein AUH78_00125 [Gemmatimonadetes bacterium 13_1_40CM_4_69_8]